MLDERYATIEGLRQAGRHDAVLSLLQDLYAEAERGAPGRVEHFALMFQWQMLVEDYPPARAVLRALSEAQAARLLAGDVYFGSAARQDAAFDPMGPAGLFSLVVDMHRMLGDAGATRDLLIRLDSAQPALARRHAWLALPAVVEAGDFALAERYRGDPLALLDAVNLSARTLPLFPPPREAPRLAAEMMNLTGDVRIGIAVLRGLGRGAEADALHAALLAGLESDELRDWARRELETPGTINGEIVARQMAAEDTGVPPPERRH